MTTIPEYIDAYMRRGRVSGWSDPTIDLYGRELQSMASFIRGRGCCLATDVEADDLDAYLIALADRGRAFSSRRHIADIMSCFWSWLQDEGRVIGNPSLALAAPEKGDRELPPKGLSESQVSDFIAGLPLEGPTDLRNRAMIELLYGCGLRISECLNLDVDDLDGVQETVHVRGGKGGYDRLVPVMPTALAAVRDWLVERKRMLRGPDRRVLFIDRDGKRLTRGAVQQWFNRLNAERGPKMPHLHPHRFRHAVALHLHRRGADIRYLQCLLGHASIDTTAIYLRLVPGRLKEEYDEAMPEIETGLTPQPMSGGS